MQGAAEMFECDFNSALDALRDNPSGPAPGHPDCHPVNCYTLCKLRWVQGGDSGGRGDGWVGSYVADLERKALDEVQDMSQGGITHLMGGWVDAGL